MTRSPARGSAVAEALVAMGLVAVGCAALASTGGLAVRSLALARDTATAVSLATAQLEGLRSGPRLSGSDTRIAVDGTSFSRQWDVAGGRGLATRLDIDVRWPGHRVALRTAVLP